jgi:hypothetical protein
MSNASDDWTPVTHEQALAWLDERLGRNLAAALEVTVDEYPLGLFHLWVAPTGHASP